MVGEISTGVPEVYLARVLVGTNVGLPKIAVDQNWPDRSSIFGESIQKARDQLFHSELNYVLVKLPVAVSLEIEQVCLVNLSSEEMRPAAYYPR